MIERYSSRIADAYIYIKQKVIHPKISNRRIFLISNGLDPILRYGEKWGFLSDNQKDKYCFYFIQSDLKDDKKVINDIWQNFEKETGIEVAIIEDELDIIKGEENIYINLVIYYRKRLTSLKKKKKMSKIILILII